MDNVNSIICSNCGRQGVKRVMLLVSLLLSTTVLFAQDIVEVEGEYTYVTSSEMSVAEAKRVAQERAKLQALADRFGTAIRQQNSTHINNSNTASTIDFLSIGNSEVKGEWVADIKEPVFEISFSDNNLIVKASVWGKAREIISASVDISAFLLRNGKERKFESDVFRSGDDMYLKFRSPIDGYLAIYLVDENSMAYRLLPYSGVDVGAQFVESGKDYVFFDSDCASTEQERNTIDELTITTDKNVEHNEIFILFSANQFVKPNDSKTDESLPKSLNADVFQKWLAKNRTKDAGMVVVNKLIKITKN
ncbi:MAG: DUF4384 domain-containing protein [Phocaeicola sp.]